MSGNFPGGNFTERNFPRTRKSYLCENIYHMVFLATVFTLVFTKQAEKVRISQRGFENFRDMQKIAPSN